MSEMRQRLVVGLALPAGAAVVGLLAVLVPAVVPLVLVVGLASLVRLGRSVFDRVMTALALAVGLLVAAGLVLSLWPWGLDPVPVAVAAWAGLWCLAVATGRRPAFPRWSAADAAIPVTTLVALVPAWYLLRADGATGRLAIAMIGEDNSRHLMWWRGIREAGSYLFLAGDRYPDSVVRGWDTYPQGWHLVAAVLDRFGVPVADGMIDRYLVLVLLTHVYLLLNIVWLALVTWRRAGVLQVVAASFVGAALATGGELFRPLVSGYPAESLGLSVALAAASVAGLASRRPPRSRLREPLVVMAGLVVATGFAYYVFLLPQGLFVAIWLWGRRRGALRSPYVVALSAAAALPLASIMPLLGVAGAVDAGGLEVEGDSAPIWISLVLLLGLAVAALAATGAWRDSAVRWALVAAACYLGFGGVVAVIAQSGYYVHKVWHLPIAVAVALCAAMVLRVPILPGRVGLVRSTIVQVAIAAAVAVGSGVTTWGPGAFTGSDQAASNLEVWRDDFWRQTAAATAVETALEEPTARPGTTSFVVDVDGFVDYRANLFLSVLQGTSAELFDVHYIGVFDQPRRLALQLGEVRGKVRLLATSPNAAAMAAQVVGEHDDPARVRVVRLPIEPPG